MARKRLWGLPVSLALLTLLSGSISASSDHLPQQVPLIPPQLPVIGPEDTPETHEFVRSLAQFLAP
jgi:hypothetical protein